MKLSLRKGIAGVLSVGVLLSVCASFTASAGISDRTGGNEKTPHTIFVTFNGSPRSARGFTWYTNASGLASQVEYGKSKDLSDAVTITGQDAYEVDGGDRNITDGVTSDSKTFKMTPTADTIKVYCHKANLTNLDPGTTYYYKVGDVKNGLSKEGSFTTEDADDTSFNFIDVTDTQAAFTDSDYYSNWAPLLNKAFATDPKANFVMDCGDITNQGGDINQWYDFTDAAQSQLLHTTFVPIAGNHESYLAKTYGDALDVSNNFADAKGGHTSSGVVGGYFDSFINHFNLALPSTEAAATTHSGAYYDFTYSNALIMVINTNALNTDGTLSADQISWLKSEASASSAKWKIVAFHRAVQSIGSHIADIDVQALRAQLLPIMAQDGIDLVLQGHDHTYVRSKVIGTAGTPVSATEVKESYNGVDTTFAVNPAGTVYVINGASNDKNYVDNFNGKGYEVASQNVYVGFSVPSVTGNTIDDKNDHTGGSVATLPTYSVVSVDGDKLVVTTYIYDTNTDDQNVIESYGLAKSDQSALIAKIYALPSGRSKTNADKVKAVYAEYDALDTIGKAAVTNADRLNSLYEIAKKYK